MKPNTVSIITETICYAIFILKNYLNMSFKRGKYLPTLICKYNMSTYTMYADHQRRQKDYVKANKKAIFIVSRTKKTVIVHVVFVNSVMWAEGWERGERGEAGPPSKWGFFFIFARSSIKRLLVYCVNIKYLYVM